MSTVRKGINNVMDYKKHYKLLCERAKTRSLDGYIEKHHIIPRCMGGTDDSDNLVNLTPEEHYVAHQLLVKMHPDHSGLVWAAHQMTRHSNKKRKNNKLYGWLKRKNQKIAKRRVGQKNGSYGRSWYHNPDTLENRKCFENEVPSGFVKGRKLKENPSCIVCGTMTETLKAKYCPKCRYSFLKEVDIGDINTLYKRYKNGESLRQIAQDVSVSHVTLYKRFKKLK